MSLPTREQFEEWSPAQVAGYLSQIKMRECATTVQRMKIDGRRFLSLSDSDLNKFSLFHRPQLQKIVQDIKKNDDSLFNRLKRFQSEQTANILKTGRNTLDRLKNKGPPKLPARDYPGDNQESDQWSGSDFDSDVYEDPQGDPDDNYEPPPCEKVFSPSPSIAYPKGEYLDTRSGRTTQTKPIRSHRPVKPAIPEKHSQAVKDDEDYIDPEDDVDDNYIDPSEKEQNASQGSQQGRSHSPDVYEVPDHEDSPLISRCSNKLQPPAQRLPPKPSPRTNVKKPVSCPEPESDDDYEICNDECLPEKPRKTSIEEKLFSIPKPLPREQKCLKPSPFQRPSLSTDHEAPAASVGRDSASSTPTGFYRINRMPLPRTLPGQNSAVAEKGSMSQEDAGAADQDEEAGVCRKSWYASTCDRRTAEDALIRSAKDGSYLVRKSSGVDALQPYTLVLFYNNRVYNIPVRYLPASKQYALGKQKNGEERFSSVSDMIENHQKNPLVLVDTQSNTKDSTKLRHTVKL